MPKPRVLGLLGLVMTQTLVAAPQSASIEDGARAVRQGHFEQAFQVWKPLADKGAVEAQATIGVMYHAGQGVEQDYEKAVEWYRKAAEKGDAASQANLGVMYAKGVGVAPDLVQAYAWFEVAESANGTSRGHGRDQLAKRLSTKQLAEAASLAREFAKKYVSPFRKPATKK